MADSEMLKHNSICICDYIAAISKRDPRKCLACQSVTDHNDVERLRESTGEPITTLEAERTRNEKEVESQNSAGNADNINNSFSSDAEEFSDDLTLGEFLRNLKAVKVNKNKGEQNALEVEEASLSMANSSSSGSYGWLGGLELPGSVSRMHEPVVGAGSYGRLGGLMLPGSESWMHEPVVGGGSYGRLGGLMLPGSESWMHEPVVGAGTYGRLGGLMLPGSASWMHESVVGAGSSGRLDGLTPWNNDGLVCSVSKNPAEFNTRIAKRFMRRM